MEVNASSEGTDAYQIREGGGAEQEEGREGAPFSPTEQNFNFKESFLP